MGPEYHCIFFLVMPGTEGLNALYPGHFSGLHLQWVALEVKLYLSVDNEQACYCLL